MRIRLGTPYFTPTYKDRSANNTGLPEHAEREIEYNLRLANQSYINALKTDGADVLLFRKTKEGRRCTCKYAEPNAVDSDSLFNDRSNKPENSLIRVRGSWDDRNKKENFHKEALGVDIGRVTPDDDSNRQQITTFPSIDQDEISAFLNGPSDSRALQSGEGVTACGICLGTGFTNAYSLYNGLRQTFDYLNLTSSRGFTVDKDKRPYTFKTSGEDRGQYLEWEFELPKYFMNVINVQVRNNLNPTQAFRLLVKKDETVAEATKQNLKNITGKCTLRVEPYNPKERLLELTHVELALQFSTWIKTQIPQLQSTTSFSSPETVNNMELHLPPSVQSVSNEDLILDGKYNKAWVITDTTDLQTAKKQILDWTLQARSLTSFDIRSLVKVSKVPEYGVSYDGIRGDY